VITQFDISLADWADARAIAELSRDTIERGLSWRWTAQRVTRSIRDLATNVVVARQGGHFLGFAILKYEEDEAHLLLLAVHPVHRRKGVASAMLAWLETTLRVAGITHMQLETRVHNADAVAFYRGHGFHEAGLHEGYYEGVEDALRMRKNLSRAAD
jgi:ribosomal-protein-alanine N-acetyltransferase